MWRFLLCFCCCLFVGTVFAQEKFFTKTGTIDFFSEAPLEDIEARNRTVTAVLDTKTGALQFSVQMKGFAFDKELMQEHFNDDYVESAKFPRADFAGSISNNGDINYTKPGTYTARVKGKLNLHGVTREVETTGTIKVGSGSLEARSVFHLLLSDYGIRIPPLAKDQISNRIRVTVSTQLQPFKG